MTSNDQEQRAALYGPAGKADHKRGDTVTFSSDDTGGQRLNGEILHVRAPGAAIVGGRSHPLTYMVYVKGETLPRIVYLSDIIIFER